MKEISDIAHKPIVITSNEKEKNTLAIIVRWSETKMFTAKGEKNAFSIDLIDIDKTIEEGAIIFDSLVFHQNDIESIAEKTSVIKKPDTNVYQKLSVVYELIKDYVNHMSDEVRLCEASMHSIESLADTRNEEVASSMYQMVNEQENLLIGFHVNEPLTREFTDDINHKIIEMISEYVSDNSESLENNLEQFLDKLEYEVINSMPDTVTIKEMFYDREKIRQLILDGGIEDIEER